MRGSDGASSSAEVRVEMAADADQIRTTIAIFQLIENRAERTRLDVSSETTTCKRDQ